MKYVDLFFTTGSLALLIFTGFVIAAPEISDFGARVIGSSTLIFSFAVARKLTL